MMEIKTVGIACDHAGFALKQFVKQYLEEHSLQGLWNLFGYEL